MRAEEPALIFNAKDRLLSENPGTLPDVSGALLDWFQPLTFRQMTKTPVGFRLHETATDICTKGVIQPFSAQQLNLKPEGQRSWKWFTIHALPGCPLEPDDVVVQVNVKLGNTPYRVMSKHDYSAYGYVRYDVVQGYDGDLS